ncbi:response regulator PleD [bacterium BMS3Abin02]|nr:response regulator PleD [bacterium BMS3Abin02]GBE21221.1 response regulator PleD [bacterium BMS3Bbin01]
MKVLVADDSPVIRAVVTSLLCEAGFEVVTASDGFEAIKAFYAELPDLVLLDIKMPKMTGYVVCRLIKEDYTVAHIPVLILTALDSAEDRYWSEKSGADGYLTKESLGQDLVGAIRSARATRALSELNRDQEPKQLDTVDVLARVTDLLDRKLFDATIINDIVTMATRPGDLAGTLGELLHILRRFVGFDVAAIALASEKRMAARLESTLSRGEFDEFKRLVAGHLDQLSAVKVSPDELGVWFAEPPGFGWTDSGQGWPSFFAMSLRSRGEVLGILALASRRAGQFTPQVARTLRMVEFPMAAVVDSASYHQKLLEQEARLSLSSLYGDPHG